MNRNCKNVSSLSKRHFRRIIANKTAQDLLNCTYMENVTVNKPTMNEVVESASIDDAIESDIFSNIELNEEEVNADNDRSDSSDESLNECNEELVHSSNECSEESVESSSECEELVEQCIRDIESDKENNNKDGHQFIKDIASWAVMFNISHIALAALLAILRKYTQYMFPKDPRTLLKTPRHTAVVNMGSGYYWHFGLKNALKNMLDKYNTVLGQMTVSLNIFINIDGLPLSRSSNSVLWPILCSDTVLKSVFIIGAYYGQTKPQCNNEFLRYFVDEAIVLINNGLVYNGITVQINLHGLICDAPAKAFILSIKSHTGYNSCTRCTITGKHLHGRLCFPATKIVDTLRIDEEFANNKYDDFQNGETILKQIPNFGLISNVVLDYMHAICLGVVKKLILLWVKGPRTVQLSQRMLNQISGALLNLQNSVPNDFVRRPRSLNEVKLWKATEFRQFILYTGPVVLKGILRDDMYINFITLHIAVTILASPLLLKDDNNILWAQALMEYFLQCFKQIYGAQFMSHNLHTLLHISSDVRQYGPIDEFSAFRFENYMSNIKKMLRKNEKPLQQLANRYSELNNFNLPIRKWKNNKEICLEKVHYNGPLIDNYIFSSQYKILRTKTYTIHANSRSDNCISLENGTIVSVLNLVTSNDNKQFIIGKKLKVVKNLYSDPVYPCASEYLGVQVMCEDTAVCLWPCDKLRSKMWKMPYNQNQFVVFPVIHT